MIQNRKQQSDAGKSSASSLNYGDRVANQAGQTGAVRQAVYGSALVYVRWDTGRGLGLCTNRKS